MSVELLFWLLPTGWLAALAQWFASRHRRKTLLLRGQTDDLLACVANLKNEIYKAQRESLNLYEQIRLYNQALAAAGSCGNVRDCPVLYELQKLPASRFEPECSQCGANSAAGNFDQESDS